MLNRILSTAEIEFRIALRNRWVAMGAAMMVLFSLVLSAAGASGLAADPLSVIVASLVSLAVYLVPPIALLLWPPVVALLARPSFERIQP